MANLDDIVRQKLQGLADKGLGRAPKPSVRRAGLGLERDGGTYLSFSDNDYLGLTFHPAVVEAARQATLMYGAGSGASRLVTGDNPLYGKLEARLAAAKGTEAACVFGSGYLANLGTLQALVGPEDLIVADKLVHACMLDGARLSGAKLLRFAHNDPEHCRTLLGGNRGKYRHCVVMTETVFSMDGDRAPLAELSELAQAHDGWLMTDDAHGYGLPPPSRELNPALIQMGTLSKSVGAYGGYIAGSAGLIAYLKSSARSLVFSTALPPGALGAALAAIEIIESSPGLRAAPLERARQFTAALNLAPAQSAIVPLVLGDNEKALAASRALAERGFLVTAIRPPTVPEGTARLRLTFSAGHTPEQVAGLVDAIREVGLCA